MYNEENNSSFIKGIIVRILLVLLFVFLLVWLFPMPNLNPFYSRIFAENVNLMKDAAKDYFTVERLPENEGDKVKITLEEMLEKKMILPFVDEDGNSCSNTESYVEVVKMDGEYMFKINLSCPTKTDYVIDYFGCYDVCPTCDKEEEKEEEEDLVLEYQFSKTSTRSVVDKYVCPTDYKLDGKTCVKTTGSTETKEADINCKTGYTYNSTSKTCEKTNNTTEDAVVSCKTGYTYNSTSKTCEKINTTTVSANRECPVNYTYNTSSAKCEYKTTKTENATKSCDAGYNYNETSKTCEKSTTTQKDAEVSCSKGTYDKDSKTCKYNAIDNDGKVVTTKKYTTWICSNVSYTSTKSEYTNDTFSRDYVTRNVEYNNCGSSTCITYKYVYEECSRKITYSYSCANTSYKYNDGKCSKTVTKTVAPTYTCPIGTLNGTKCDIVVPEQKTPTYTCAAGTLNGTNCNISVTLTSNVSYSCESGYILSNDKCTKKTISTETPTYACSSGTLNGSICNITNVLKENPTYSCASGYTSISDKCYKDTTIKDVKDASVTYKTEKYTQYTWSKNKTLSGWIYTGKTRKVSAK